MSSKYTVEDAEAILLQRGAESIRRAIFPELENLKESRSQAIGTHPRIGKKNKFYFSLEKPFWDEKTSGASGNWYIYCRDERGLSYQDYIALLERETGLQISSASPEQRAEQKRAYEERKKKESLLEDAFTVMRENLYQPAGAHVLEYLKQVRGYSDEQIENMSELGVYTSPEHLISELEHLGYGRDEIFSAGLLNPALGSVFQLSIMIRGRAGTPQGMIIRSLLSAEELEHLGYGKKKYHFLSGSNLSGSIIGLDARKAQQAGEVVLVEGVLDFQLLKHYGFSAGALGGDSLKPQQIEHLKLLGISTVRLALDADEAGIAGTKKAIKDLLEAGIKPFVVIIPDGYKDPDELITQLKSPAIFRREVNNAKTWTHWSIWEIFSRYPHREYYPVEMEKALVEASGFYVEIKSTYEAQDALIAIRKLSKASELEIDERIRKYQQDRAELQSKNKAESIQQELQQALSLEDTKLYEVTLEQGLSQMRGASSPAPEPYSTFDFLRDITEQGEGLTTGWQSLDRLIRIPIGAVSIIAGRPRHGKTTTMLNLALQLLQNPSQRVAFFSYEEHKRDIAKKLIMILSGEVINPAFNQDAFTHYLKYSRAKEPRESIEQALAYYDELVSSGRLWIVDKHYPAEALAGAIHNLASEQENLAVFADYIQKIKPEDAQAQRYQELGRSIELLEEQAIAHSIPVIVGAQFKRDNNSTGVPKLELLRESGNLEQTASLVLGLYKTDEEQDEERETKAIESPLQVHVLKNRAGGGSGYAQLTLEGAPLRVIDKKAQPAQADKNKSKLW